MAGQIKPALNIYRESGRFRQNELLRDIERAMADGKLRDSLIAPIVFRVLETESNVELVSKYDRRWITSGIQDCDEYFSLVRSSAGVRNWQHDFAKVAAPALVGVAHSLEQSAQAQALVIQLCECLAEQLKLRIVWPNEEVRFNELANEIYIACVETPELESDEVLAILGGLTVVGPKS